MQICPRVPRSASGCAQESTKRQWKKYPEFFSKWERGSAGVAPLSSDQSNGQLLYALSAAGGAANMKHHMENEILIGMEDSDVENNGGGE